jgi:hypothetical protein
MSLPICLRLCVKILITNTLVSSRTTQFEDICEIQIRGTYVARVVQNNLIPSRPYFQLFPLNQQGFERKEGNCNNSSKSIYSVFQGFSYAKFAYGGSILSSSQFLILPQLPQKMKLTLKVVKIDPKIIVSLPTFKSLKLTVDVQVSE